MATMKPGATPAQPAPAAALFLEPTVEWARAYDASPENEASLEASLLPTLRYWAAVVAHRPTQGLRATDTLFANEASGHQGLRRRMLEGWASPPRLPFAPRISPAMWAYAWHARLTDEERAALTHLARTGQPLPALTMAELHVATLEQAIRAASGAHQVANAGNMIPSAQQPTPRAPWDEDRPATGVAQ